VTKAIFTVCNIAYLPRALVLAKSVYEHDKSVLHIYIFDQRRALPQLPDYIVVHWPDEFFGKRDLNLAFKYDIIELSTALKPFIALSLLKDYYSVIFLDPDTKIYRSLDSIWSILSESSSVLLTPHYLKPQPDNDYESDLPMMRFGSFNLGFFAITRSPSTYSFLHWWDKRCRRLCYMESQNGLSTDQKWISIAPCLFSCIKILYDPTLNVAPWNLFERRVTIDNGDFTIDHKDKLTFFHFSNFDHADLQYNKCRTSTCSNDDWPELEYLSSLYSAELKVTSEYLRFVNPRYTFEYFASGEYITPLLRRAYASNEGYFSNIDDPFNSYNILLFAKKNRLLSRNNKKYVVRKNLLNTSNQFSKTLNKVYFLMRMLLWIVGPNTFFDMMKGLVLISLTRKHPALWRFD